MNSEFAPRGNLAFSDLPNGMKVRESASRKGLNIGEDRVACDLCSIRRADVKTPCGHCLHARCIFQLPLIKCPVCDASITTSDGLKILPIEPHDNFDALQCSSGELDNDHRIGRWHTYETAYTQHIIEDFEEGTLPITEGTKLASFLCGLLNCNHTRLSKKLKVGKKYYTLASPRMPTKEALLAHRSRQRRISELEEMFLMSEGQTARGGISAPVLSHKMQKEWRERFVAYAHSLNQKVVDAWSWNPMANPQFQKYGNCDSSQFLSSSLPPIASLCSSQPSVDYEDEHKFGFSSGIDSFLQSNEKIDFQQQFQKGSSDYLDLMGRTLPQGWANEINTTCTKPKNYFEDSMENVKSEPECNDSKSSEVGSFGFRNSQSWQEITPTISPSSMDIEAENSASPKSQGKPCENMSELVEDFLKEVPFEAMEVWVPLTRNGIHENIILFHAGFFSNCQEMKEWGMYSSNFSYQRGVGMVGRVFESNRYEWFDDVTKLDESVFLRKNGAVKVNGFC